MNHIKLFPVYKCFLTEFINENAFSLATKLSIVPLELLSTVPAVILPGLILRIAKLLINVSGAAHVQTWQKIYSLHLMQSTD